MTINLDFDEIGNWPTSIKIFMLTLISIGILGIGYWGDTVSQITFLQQLKNEEKTLRHTFEQHYCLATLLEAHRKQRDEMNAAFHDRLKYLPKKNQISALLEEITTQGNMCD